MKLTHVPKQYQLSVDVRQAGFQFYPENEDVLKAARELSSPFFTTNLLFYELETFSFSRQVFHLLLIKDLSTYVKKPGKIGFYLFEGSGDASSSFRLFFAVAK